MKKVLVLLLALTGCASTPKPLNYHQAAVDLVVPEYCAMKGWMPTEVAAQAAYHMREWRTSPKVDQVQLKAQEEYVRGALHTLRPEHCKQKEIGILAHMQGQKDARYQQEEAQRLADKMAAPAGRTFCNNIGGYVLCNSY